MAVDVQLSPVHHLPWAIAVSSDLHWATALAQVKYEKVDEPPVLAADGPAVSCPPPALGHSCLKCSSLGHSPCSGKIIKSWWALSIGCWWSSCHQSTTCPGPLLPQVLFIGPQPLRRWRLKHWSFEALKRCSDEWLKLWSIVASSAEVLKCQLLMLWSCNAAKLWSIEHCKWRAGGNPI